MFKYNEIKKEFPILKRKVNGQNLHYLDNGASSQKPQVVIDAISKYYSEINANIHRGVHTLSQKATDAYEESRKKLQVHFNAKYDFEILFTALPFLKDGKHYGSRLSIKNNMLFISTYYKW